MVKYRLTTKGKVVAAASFTFTILCISIGILNNNKEFTNNYTYEKPNYESVQLTFQPEPPLVNIEKEKPLDPINATIYFDADKIGFDTEYNEILNKLSEAVLLHEASKIQIEGNSSTQYPSSQKHKNINYKLSMLRAQSVADYLITKGIDSERIIVVANGSDKPFKDNSSPENRKFNRRVDVFLINN